MIFKARALLFDMDGTLLDTDFVSQLVWGDWAKRNQVSFEAIMKVHHGRRPEETLSLVAPHLNPADHIDWIYDEHAKITTGFKLIPGGKELFNSLPLSAVALVTSASKALVINRFSDTGLNLQVAMVTSDVVTKGKPHPEPYLRAAAMLKLEPKDCIVFEDAPAGIQSAKAAGMQVIALKTTHAAAALTQADCIIDDYHALRCSFQASEFTLNISEPQ